MEDYTTPIKVIQEVIEIVKNAENGVFPEYGEKEFCVVRREDPFGGYAVEFPRKYFHCIKSILGRSEVVKKWIEEFTGGAFYESAFIFLDETEILMRRHCDNEELDMAIEKLFKYALKKAFEENKKAVDECDSADLEFMAEYLLFPHEFKYEIKDINKRLLCDFIKRQKYDALVIAWDSQYQQCRIEYCGILMVVFDVQRPQLTMCQELARDRKIQEIKLKAGEE